MGGRPSSFLQLLLGLPGLPALETLNLEAPITGFFHMHFWMKQAFQVGSVAVAFAEGASLP